METRDKGQISSILYLDIEERKLIEILGPGRKMGLGFSRIVCVAYFNFLELEKALCMEISQILINIVSSFRNLNFPMDNLKAPFLWASSDNSKRITNGG